MIKLSKIFEVYQDQKNNMYTENLTPGKSSFREICVHQDGKEYRQWDPKRSKLAAALMKGCANVFIRKGNVVLYLGAAHGYTSSFVSDMVGKEGFVFALDSAPRVVRDLVFLCKERENMAPLLADAHHPENYVDKLCQVDVVYQDIAQRDQADIFVRNCELFLKPGGYGLVAIKARSIDVRRKPRQIFDEVRALLDKKMPVVDFKILDPYELDHCFIICKKR